MKRIIFYLSEILLDQLEEAVLKDGFQSRSELLRFLIMDYLKKHPNAESGADGEGNVRRNEDEEIDLEFGIPPHVIKEIEEMARAKTENDRRLGLLED